MENPTGPVVDAVGASAVAPPFTAWTDKADEAYVPNYAFDGDLINATHGSIHSDVASIEGWLLPEDALKLYELAYFTPGPFLEIGTCRGKSTVVLCQALRDAGREVEFYSLDIDQDALESARRSLGARKLGRQVSLVHGSVGAFFRVAASFRPGFVFVDGDHSFDGVRRDLAVLEPRVPTGALVFLHDYLDERNEDPSQTDYGVTQGVRQSWLATDCEFAGTFGCGALFRRLRGPVSAESDTPALIGLTALDPLPLRIRARLVMPARERARRMVRWARRRRQR